MTLACPLAPNALMVMAADAPASKPRAMAVLSASPVLLHATSYGDCEARVQRLPERQCLIVTLDGYLPASHAPAFVTELLQAATRWQPLAIVVDARRLKTLSDATQLEMQTRLFPGLAEVGVLRSACITPESFLASRSVIEMIEEAPFRGPPITRGDLEIAMFGTLKACFAWIEELALRG